MPSYRIRLPVGAKIAVGPHDLGRGEIVELTRKEAPSQSSFMLPGSG